MCIRFVLAITAFCTLTIVTAANAVAPASSANATPSTYAAKERNSLQMIVFEDPSGKSIPSSQFNANVKGGQRYIMRKDVQAGQFIMKLLPPDVNTPGAMSWADLNGASSPFSTMLVHGVHYKVVFHDEHGNMISQTAFAAGAARHQRYTTKLDKQNDTAILTLLPIGESKAGAQSTSIWKLQSPMNMEPTPKPGSHLAQFDMPMVRGGRIDNAKLKGRPYVVDFFFADCIGCIAELPVLNKYHAQYPKQLVIAVTFDDAQTAAGFVKQRHFTWPVAYNGKAFTDKLGLKVYPTMIVVSADGKVLATRIGADDNLSARGLEHWVTASIKGLHKSPHTP